MSNIKVDCPICNKEHFVEKRKKKKQENGLNYITLHLLQKH